MGRAAAKRRTGNETKPKLMKPFQTVAAIRLLDVAAALNRSLKDGVGRSRAQIEGMKKREDQRIRPYVGVSNEEKGIGPDSAGQSGDIQGLPDVAEADSESVEELVEEGQAFEAEAISGVEDAPDADVAEVHTRQVPEDDVPPEYQDKD